MLAVRTLWPILLHSLATCASGVENTDSWASRCNSDSFSKPHIGRGATILSVSAKPQHNFTSIKGGPSQPPVHNLTFCQVQVNLTHQARTYPDQAQDVDKDHVLVEVWLPLEQQDWNGRMQATGGAGFATGMFGAHLGAAVRDGWAAVSTDGGHDADLEKVSDASWMLSDPKKLGGSDEANLERYNWGLIHNLASRSPIDQILVGKNIVEQYYGKKPHHSYWNGCSTGGRQGYAVAQKYPELVDGILAEAPAVSFVNVVMGALWPHVVMRSHQMYLSNCELEYFRARAIEGCERTLDMKTGILIDPVACNWFPDMPAGSTFECDGEEFVVTDQTASVIHRILAGPKYKYPVLARGVPMTRLAGTEPIDEDGIRSPIPFGISASWLRYATLSARYHGYAGVDEERHNEYWIETSARFGGVLNTDDPDLSRLRDSNTKMMTWHGINDELIPYQNTINYRKKVEGVMGGAAEVDDYFRLFLAPGVGHCGGGIGPAPKDPLDALVRWVEDNDPPETLDAEGINQQGDLVTRDLCLWPAAPQYMGIGDINRASSWSCIGGTPRPASPEQIVEDEFDYGSMQQPEGVHIRGHIKEHGSDRSKEILDGLKDRIEGLGMGLRVD